MGGPDLMVIGLLHDQATYISGFWYLFLYNLILIIPLAVVLTVAANKALVDKVTDWKNRGVSEVKFWAGLAMIILGILIFYI